MRDAAAILRRRRQERAWSVEWIDEPWLGPLHLARVFADLPHFPTCDELNERLSAPVRFVPAPRKRVVGAYESRAAIDGEVLTRAHSWHDLMNALVWATFPVTKLTLTRTLVAVQARAGAGPARDRSHDLLALFDEGGVIRDGTQLIWFGHALYEHRLLMPELPLRASQIVVAPGARSLDARLAEAIVVPEFLTTRQPTVALADAVR